MGTAELRKDLHIYIDKADDKFLRMVHALRKEYEGTDAVGYKVDGTPITKEDVRKRVKAASARVKAGDYISQEDLEKEVEGW
jgi:predicted ribonuclease YlaK